MAYRIILMLFVCIYEIQTFMYRQEIQRKEYEKHIAMYNKQMDNQQIEYERQIAVLHENKVVTV